jgi:hypothetical protein
VIGSRVEDSLRALGRLLDGQQTDTAFVGVGPNGVTVTAIGPRRTRREWRLGWVELAELAREARQARGRGGLPPVWPLDCQNLLRLAGQEMARVACHIAFIVVHEHELIVDFGDPLVADRQVYPADLLRQRLAARLAGRGVAQAVPG